jgi:hypothetical protein
MTVIAQPFYDGLAAYRPVKFTTFITLDNAAYLNPIAYVTVYKNGTAIVEDVRYDYAFSEVSTLPFETDYTFYIDIQKFCQDSLAPTKSRTTTFAPSGSGVGVNTDCYADYYIEVVYWATDVPTNLLTVASSVTLDTSSTYTVTCASLQHLQTMNLKQYYGTLGFQDGVALTKSSRTLNNVDSDSIYLSVLTPHNLASLSTFEVNLYNSSGGLEETGLFRFSTLSYINQITLNVGFDSLASLTYIQGAPNFANANVTYYTISFGISALIGSIYVYGRHTEIFTYNRTSVCSSLRSLRCHWLNLLGGVDSYTFNSEKELVISTEYDTAQGALSWDVAKAVPDNKQDVGNFKYNSRASSKYNLLSLYLTNDEATWLSELFMSTKVYAAIDGVFIPVVIDKTETSIARHNGKIRLRVVAILSNDYIIPRI